MSVLEEVLEEEYHRSVRLRMNLEREISALPKGSVRVRQIRGREYYYLNYREGDKVRSDYIPADEVDELREKIMRRRQLKAALAEQARDQKKLERALGRRPHVD
ncbi:MAG: hypothetical protein Q4B77_05085 [Coriobacteriaceae bacterium]|nr:hypothetical protein [Coriobacteriaceae bacterium]